MILSELCNLVTMQVDPRDRDDEVYVGLEHLASGRFERVGEGKASDVQSAKYAFQPGDVLYGKLRPYLDKAVLARDVGICTTELLVLRPKAGVDPRFLVSLVHCPSFVEHAVSGTTGVQHPRTSWHHISGFELPDFGSREQTKIANLLWALHDAATANEAACQAGEDLKHAAMRALFSRSLRGETQKETEIGPVPANWKVGPVGELARFQRGFDITKKEQADGDVPVVSSGGIKSFHNVAAAKGPGVLIGRKGSIGLLHYVETDYWPHDTTLWCTDYQGNVPKFVFYRLHGVDMQKLDSGATNPALNRNYLHDEMVSWPEPDEQREIVAIIDAIDQKIQLHRRKRVMLDQLFKSLLHKLITGKLRVADLDLPGPNATQLTEANA
jgi:type I restriction enzyme S subunit